MARQRQIQGFQPRLETLEGRLCLSVTVTTAPLQNGNNELKIAGDSAADTVNITVQADGHVDVTDGSNANLGSADNVSRILFNGKNGTDTVNYSLAGNLTHSQSVFVNLGSGGDGSATFDLSQGVTGANLHIFATGNQGNDTLSATLGSLSNSHSSIYFDGVRGNDNLSLTGAAASIAADSSLDALLYGGRGDDTIITTLDAQILGKLRYAADGGDGTDTLASNITANSGSTGKATLFSAGGRGADNVTLNVTDNSGSGGASTLAALHAVIFNPRDIDTVTNTDNVHVVTGRGHDWGGHDHGALSAAIGRAIAHRGR